jgi:Leucine-rich repeat (LRR) protein
VVISDDAVKVDLSSRGIRVVPKEILALKMLESLSLGFNKLSSLDPDIKQLSTLTKLVLTGNLLKSLPDEIGTLSELREVRWRRVKAVTVAWYVYSGFPSQLAVSKNSLTSLPASISNRLRR